MSCTHSPPPEVQARCRQQSGECRSSCRSERVVRGPVIPGTGRGQLVRDSRGISRRTAVGQSGRPGVQLVILGTGRGQRVVFIVSIHPQVNSSCRKKQHLRGKKWHSKFGYNRKASISQQFPILHSSNLTLFHSYTFPIEH